MMGKLNLQIRVIKLSLVLFCSLFLLSCNENDRSDNVSINDSIKLRNYFAKHLSYCDGCYLQSPFDPFIQKEFNGYTLDIRIRRSISSFLYALEEEGLLKNQRSEEIFRFLWLRSFDVPIVFKIEKFKDNKILYTVKYTDGKGGYYPGVLKAKLEKILDVSIWKKFSTIVSEASYYQLKPFDTSRYMKFACDGASWLIESKSKGKYNFVLRWSPDYLSTKMKKDSVELVKFANIGKFLIGLSDFDFKKDHNY